MVVLRGARLVGLGLVIGLPVALLSSRILTLLLVGVTPGDVVTYAAVVVLLVVTGLLAAFAPARRAASVNPTTVLTEGN
jgi:ABC-type antimicrobial peptide transport system permease subunit